MDHILLWAVIALVVLIFGTTWKWLRNWQLRSRRKKGNNYLYQEYNYDHDIDYRAIDLAWESHRENIQNHQSVEENLELELDSEQLNTDEAVTDNPWKDYRDHLSLNQAIEGYLNLELDIDLAEEKGNIQENYVPLSADYKSNEDVSSGNYDRDKRQAKNIHDNSEVTDD